MFFSLWFNFTFPQWLMLLWSFSQANWSDDYPVQWSVQSRVFSIVVLFIVWCEFFVGICIANIFSLSKACLSISMVSVIVIVLLIISFLVCLILWQLGKMGFDIFRFLQEGFMLTINLCFGIVHTLRHWESLSNIVWL